MILFLLLLLLTVLLSTAFCAPSPKRWSNSPADIFKAVFFEKDGDGTTKAPAMETCAANSADRDANEILIFRCVVIEFM